MIKYIDRKSGKEIKENPPAAKMLKFLYGNPLGRLSLLPLIKRKFVSAWYGGKMDKPSSTKKIQGFVDQLSIDMSESQKSIEEFKTFNDFFFRHLKPEARPIGEDLISVGDGRLLAFEEVSEVSNFYVKGRKFTLKEFLANEKLASKYDDGSMIILRLAPNDYHRFHFPYDGVPAKTHKIKGDYYSVSPIALAANFTKVFCENKREYVELNTKDKGDILLVPVGATMVGGIVETYEHGQQVAKGDEMGYFAFGGSTVVILTQKGKFAYDKDLIDNTNKGIETYVKMGETIGS